MIDLSEFFRITGLALADSINPCAIAVLTMILMSILIKNPGKKEKVLYAGLSFILAVYVGYLFYGIIIVYIKKAVLLQKCRFFYVQKLKRLSTVLPLRLVHFLPDF